MNVRTIPARQHGVATLIMALLILVALAIMVMASSRLVLVQHRMSANSARADAAFAAAESGAQNALAYLNANRAVVASSAVGGWRHASSTPRWTACGSGQTALPCGNGSANLYDASWRVYGPLPNQQALPGSYTAQSWLLSDTLEIPAPPIPYLGCLQVGLTSVLPAVTVTLVNTLNGILSSLLGALLGQPGLGLPTNLCLPLNFSQMPPAPRPSTVNPGINIVASAADSTDPFGGAAQVQQTVAASNLFAGLPPASLMVAGTANLAGDIRIWGNPRPPTRAPMDFSVLNLNSVAGLNVTNLLDSLLASTAGSISSQINVSFAPLLNTSTAEVLAFDWNATFPLSIWSAGATTLGTTTIRQGLLGATILNGARTCTPQFGGAPTSPCLPLSQSLLTLNLLGLPLAPLLPLKLPDVQDPVNLVSAVAGLLGGGVPPFPSDLFDFTFGYPSAQESMIRIQATEQAACAGISLPGLYWVTGNCALSGTIGSATAPVVIVTNGNVTIAAGTQVWGVLYLRGNGAKTFAGPASGTRPTVRGAVVSEGAFTGSNQFNIAYDINVIRAAGYLAGGFAPLPGGWNDAVLGP